MSSEDIGETPAVQALRWSHLRLYGIVELLADGRLDLGYEEASRLLDQITEVLMQVGELPVPQSALH